MVRTTAQRDPEDAKKMHNLGSLRLRHLDSNQIILVPTPTADPNGRLNPYLRFHTILYTVLTLDLRSAQLVQEIPMVYRCLGVYCHLFLQLPRSRPFHCYRWSHLNIFWPTTNKSELRCRYLQDRLFFHHDCFDAGYGHFVLDAPDYQVWTQTCVCHILCTVHSVCRMVRSLYHLWERARV